MHSNIRDFISVIDDNMNTPDNIILLESDFVNPSTELTDDQIKQIFVIISQAAAYKKLRGNLKGYKPSLKTNKVTNEELINELDPFGGMAKATDALMAKFGSKGAKMAQVAKETALGLWKKWEKDSIKGGMVPSVESVARWVNDEEFDADLIDAAFRGVGVPNVKNSLRNISTVDRLPLTQWMDENNIKPGALNGIVLKDYLSDIDVQDRDVDAILDGIGLKNTGTVISRVQLKKLEKALDAYIPSEEPEGEVATDVDVDANTSTNTNSGTPLDGGWLARDVYSYIIKNYNVDDKDDLANEFKAAKVKNVDDEMSDDQVRKVLNSVKDDEKNMFSVADDASKSSDEIMKTTQEIVKDMGSSIKKATSVGKEFVKSGDISSTSELQKLGIAILTARKKI